ncbi:hypothetical protein KDL29_05405 [bacterium]|nr:hypothetical protein [bacterium]
MSNSGGHTVGSGALRIEYGPLPQVRQAADYAALLDHFRAPLSIVLQSGTIVSFGNSFPLLQFALDFAAWCCPHAWWLFEQYPQLRDEMEHLPGGLAAQDFALLDDEGDLIIAFSADPPQLIREDLSADNGLERIELGIDSAALRELGTSLLAHLAASIASQSGWDIAPLITRRPQRFLTKAPGRSVARELDIPRLLDWPESKGKVEQGEWQADWWLFEPGVDISGPDELMPVITGSLVLRRRVAEMVRLPDVQLLEFLHSALDWLSDASHQSMRLHRGSSAGGPVWGGFELGDPATGKLLLAMRRRGKRIELLSGANPVRGNELPEKEFGLLLLELATQLVHELHERTGWSALPLFARQSVSLREPRPAVLPRFDLLKLVLEWPGSRSIAGREKRLPAAQVPNIPMEVLLEGPNEAFPVQGQSGLALQVDISLMELTALPSTPADLQEMLRAGVTVSRGSRHLLHVDNGVPLLDFTLNCLIWLCRHDSVSPAASRERDPRRRGRPVDFILEYPGEPALRIGLREDLDGYLFVLERDGQPAGSHNVAISRGECMVLMLDIARALVLAVHQRWGWDIRSLFGPRSFYYSERALQRAETIGYMNIERDVKELSDWRNGIARDPAGCLWNIRLW